MGTAGTKDLVGLKGFGPDAIKSLLTRARELQHCPEPCLAGHTVATMFFENSTRTTVSFTIAAQMLGASTVDLAAKASSVAKGETIDDTARTIEAMGVSALIIRASENGAPAQAAKAVRCSVINAGDGSNEHPTQALADALTIADTLTAARDFDFSGLRVGIVGDVAHSRVAGSNIHSLTALGARVTLIGPDAMAPDMLADQLPVEVTHDFDRVLPDLDVVMMLRIQFERGAAIENPQSYRARYGLTTDRAGKLKPGGAGGGGALIMHPGPMNRGVEIDDAVADGQVGNGRPVIWNQVASGVVVRAAVLESCICGIAKSPSGQSAIERSTVPSSSGRRDD